MAVAGTDVSIDDMAVSLEQLLHRCCCIVVWHRKFKHWSLAAAIADMAVFTRRWLLYDFF